MLYPTIVCESNICYERYGEGFSFIIQNLNPSVDDILGTTARKEGLGYAGLASGLVVEFDFGSTLSLEDPTYPHVSV